MADSKIPNTPEQNFIINLFGTKPVELDGPVKTDTVITKVLSSLNPKISNDAPVVFVNQVERSKYQLATHIARYDTINDSVSGRDVFYFLSRHNMLRFTKGYTLVRATQDASFYRVPIPEPVQPGTASGNAVIGPPSVQPFEKLEPALKKQLGEHEVLYSGRATRSKQGIFVYVIDVRRQNAEGPERVTVDATTGKVLKQTSLKRE